MKYTLVIAALLGWSSAIQMSSDGTTQELQLAEEEEVMAQVDADWMDQMFAQVSQNADGADELSEEEESESELNEEQVALYMEDYKVIFEAIEAAKGKEEKKAAYEKAWMKM